MSIPPPTSSIPRCSGIRPPCAMLRRRPARLTRTSASCSGLRQRCGALSPQEASEPAFAQSSPRWEFRQSRALRAERSAPRPQAPRSSRPLSPANPSPSPIAPLRRRPPINAAWSRGLLMWLAGANISTATTSTGRLLDSFASAASNRSLLKGRPRGTRVSRIRRSERSFRTMGRSPTSRTKAPNNCACASRPTKRSACALNSAWTPRVRLPRSHRARPTGSSAQHGPSRYGWHSKETTLSLRHGR